MALPSSLQTCGNQLELLRVPEPPRQSSLRATLPSSFQTATRAVASTAGSSCGKQMGRVRPDLWVIYLRVRPVLIFPQFAGPCASRRPPRGPPNPQPLRGSRRRSVICARRRRRRPRWLRRCSRCWLLRSVADASELQMQALGRHALQCASRGYRCTTNDEHGSRVCY